MTSDDARILDPDRLARREFATSFRGFDQDEVRRFLESLADALRSREEPDAGLRAEIDAATRERDQLADTVAELEREVTQLVARVKEAEERAEAAEQVEPTPAPAPAPVEIDDAMLTQRLGEETVRVLATARESAREITARAEAEAVTRMNLLEEREAEVEQTLATKRADTEAELDALRSSTVAEIERLKAQAETEAGDMRAAATAETTALRADTTAEMAALRERTEQEVASTRTAAEKAATQIRSDAETEASRIRAEAEADAVASQDSARETARQMLHEAQTVRERVLTDLVKKRRAGRQQLDQAKAARDRMARALAVVRKDLDESMAELVAAVPEARRAMEAVGRRVPESVDIRQAVELAGELDSAREAGEPVDDDDAPDIDALFDRLKSGGGMRPSGTTETTADDDDPVVEEPAAIADKPADEPEVQAPVADEGDEEILDDDADVDPDADASDADPIDVDGGAAGGDDAAEHQEDGELADLPESFVARDVIMTRVGPDLRRRLKRTLADDQSAVLDGLRRAGDVISVDDLPPVDQVVASYMESLSEAVHRAAAAGAEVVGAEPPVGLIDSLIERAARGLVGPLRAKVERTVSETEADKTEALDPIRAQYRDVRAVELPEMADDTLAEAFALGLYHGIADGAEVIWVADPRTEPGADCFDNTLAGSVTKPEPFPTGHGHPPGGPGCRCLALPA